MNVEVKYSALSTMQLTVQAKEIILYGKMGNRLQVNLLNSTIGTFRGKNVNLNIAHSCFDKKSKRLQTAFALTSSIIRFSECTFEMGYSSFTLYIISSVAEIYNSRFSCIISKSSVIQMIQSDLSVSQTTFSHSFGEMIDVRDNSTLTMQHCTILDIDANRQSGCIICAVMYSALYFIHVIITQNKSSFGTVGVTINSHFSIIECAFSYNIGTYVYGGGVVIQSNSSFNIQSSIFFENQKFYGTLSLGYNVIGEINNSSFIGNSGIQGGAILASDNTWITITGTLFENNFLVTAALDGIKGNKEVISVGLGGAISLSFGANASIHDSEFIGNQAPSGGAVAALNASLFVQSCIFSENQAFWGGSILVAKSAVSILMNNTSSVQYNTSPVNVVITKSQFINNSALETFKPDNWVNITEGGAISIHFTDNVNILNSTFVGNTATLGGLIRIANSMVHVEHSTFNNNHAIQGGAIYANEGGRITTERTVFESNIAIGKPLIEKGRHVISLLASGGSIYAAFVDAMLLHSCRFTGNQAFSTGGAVSVSHNTALIVTKTRFEHNWALKGGAISALKNVNITLRVLAMG